MCVYPAVAAAAVLLIVAAVRPRVPGDTICCCGLFNLIQKFFVFSSLSQYSYLFLMYPLIVLSHVSPRFNYNAYHAR